MWIKVTKRPAYNPSSNVPAERAVRSIKGILKKNKTPMSEIQPQESAFCLNSHQQGDQGSPKDRFFKHSVRSWLPKSVDPNLQADELIQARHDRRGRTSKMTFEVSETVRLQDIRETN